MPGLLIGFGVTQIFVISVLFNPMVKSGMPANTAWQVAPRHCPHLRLLYLGRPRKPIIYAFNRFFFPGKYSVSTWVVLSEKHLCISQYCVFVWIFEPFVTRRNFIYIHIIEIFVNQMEWFRNFIRETMHCKPYPYKYIYIYLFTYIYIYIYLFTYIYVYLFTYIYINKCKYIYIYLGMPMYFVKMGMCACLYVCMHVWMHVGI